MKFIKKISLLAMLLGSINATRADQNDPQDEKNYEWKSNDDTNYVYKSVRKRKEVGDDASTNSIVDTKITRDLFGRIVERKEISIEKDGNELIRVEKIWKPKNYTTLLTGRNAGIAGAAVGAAAIGGGLYASGLLSRQAAPVAPVVEMPVEVALDEQPAVDLTMPAPAEQADQAAVQPVDEPIQEQEEVVAQEPAQPRSWMQYGKDKLNWGPYRGVPTSAKPKGAIFGAGDENLEPSDTKFDESDRDQMNKFRSSGGEFSRSDVSSATNAIINSARNSIADSHEKYWASHRRSPEEQDKLNEQLRQNIADRVKFEVKNNITTEGQGVNPLFTKANVFDDGGSDDDDDDSDQQTNSKHDPRVWTGINNIIDRAGSTISSGASMAKNAASSAASKLRDKTLSRAANQETETPAGAGADTGTSKGTETSWLIPSIWA